MLGKSCAKGPTIPLIGKTIGDVFDNTVAAYSGKDALVSRHQGLRLTYAELDRGVSEVAGRVVGLRNPSRRQGRHVGLELR